MVFIGDAATAVFITMAGGRGTYCCIFIVIGGGGGGRTVLHSRVAWVDEYPPTPHGYAKQYVPLQLLGGGGVGAGGYS